MEGRAPATEQPDVPRLSGPPGDPAEPAPSQVQGAAPAAKRPRRRSIRVRLFALVLVPLISLVALWGFSAWVTLDDALDKFKASTTYNEIGRPGSLVMMELQKERALSAVYLADPDGGRAAMDGQRARTDAAVRAFRASTAADDVQNALDSRMRHSLSELGWRLQGLGSLRSTVDGGQRDILQTIEDYSEIADTALELFAALTIVEDLDIYREGRGLITIAQAHDYMLREDALITGVLTRRDDRLNQAEKLAFIGWAAVRRQAFNGGIVDLDSALRSTVQQYSTTPDYARFQSMEAAIVDASGGRLPTLVTKGWATTVPAVGSTMIETTTKAGDQLYNQAEPIGNRVILRLVVAGGVGLGAVIVSVLISVLFGRGLARELRTLQLAARELAQDRLPGLVQRLRRGEEVDVETEAPPPASGSVTEVAEVSDAFAEVQRTAVETAVGEAHLRKGVARVFLNLAWRSQSLLHRQLRMLDSMERRTSDPDVLSDLFRLDHLTTRMRRHSEGLIILSGAAPGRGWSRPVPLEDVLRAAASEVEDYARVEVVAATPAALAGSAVADVIHLLAELIENATVFSPPTTEVLVRGELVGNGFAIEVQDRGIGIHPHERAQLNARLAQPPEFDLADSDRLGLFVVARLAARHGIKVALQESVYAGTTAVVILPLDLVGEPMSPEQIAAGQTAEELSPSGRAGTIEVPARAWFEPRHRLTAAPDKPPAQGPSAPAPGPWPEPNPGPAPRPAPGPVPTTTPGAATPEPGPPGSGQAKPALPRRLRQANIAPQLRDKDGRMRAPGGPAEEAGDRAAEQSRELMDALQFGWQRGRAEEDADSRNGNGEGR